MSEFVLDASVAAGWCLRDEETEEATGILSAILGGAPAAAPLIWRWEMANLLTLSVRRGRLDDADIDALVAFLDSLGIAFDEDSALHAMGASLALARTHRLTVYDASYLELAQRLNAPLATFDTALARAARGAGVALLL